MQDYISSLEWNLPIWVIVTALVAYFQGKRGFVGGSGLVLLYLLNLWTVHWFGALLYYLPWGLTESLDLAATGFEQATYGVIALGVGSIVVSPMVSKMMGLSVSQRSLIVPERSLPRLYMIIGFAGYFLFSVILKAVPTALAIGSVFWNLIIAASGLSLLRAWVEKDRWKFSSKFLIYTLCFPAFTILVQGFLGFGAASVLAILCFVGIFYRPRWQLIIIGCLMWYLSFSFYVTYMRDRNEIREKVWGKSAYSERIGQLRSTLSRFEWLDWHNPVHLYRIDDRLNQNLLMGAAVSHLKFRFVDFARGKTFVDAAYALIPRIIWLDKPHYAGSGNLVSQYTGIEFAYGTAVGIGQVMEFYVNFGAAGVFVGFLVLGTLMGILDLSSKEALLNGDLRHFSIFYLAGLSFVNVEGSMAGITASAMASLITVYAVNRYLLPKFKKTALANRPLIPTENTESI